MSRPRRPPALAKDEEGSVLLLTIGYMLLALVLVLICVDATSLYLAQKRLDSLADAAALAGADGFILEAGTGGARAVLTSEGVRDQAEDIVATVGAGAVLTDAATPDGLSARVTVADVWRPPVLTLFVPDGVPLQATGTSRTALR